jgi:hypothetical protein
MIRTISVCEHNIYIAPPRVLAIAAATATEIFPNQVGLKGSEIVTRYVQNMTGADLYLSFGVSNGSGGPSCDNAANFHAVLADKQLFDCFPHRQRVSAYSVSGGIVCTTILLRTDLSH